MALTVETGAIVPGADSYVDVAYVRDFLSSRGYDLSEDDATIEGHIRIMTDFIDEEDFKGHRIETDQPLAWPRGAVYLRDDRVLDDDKIPEKLKQAVAWGLLYRTQGNLFEESGTDNISEAQVSVIKVKFTNRTQGYEDKTTLSDMVMVYRALSDLLVGGGIDNRRIHRA